MRSTMRGFLGIVVTALLAGAGACGSGDEGSTVPVTPPTTGNGGSGGSSPPRGSGTGGDSGSTGSAGSGGSSGSAGSGGSTAGTGGGSAGSGGATAGSGGSATGGAGGTAGTPDGGEPLPPGDAAPPAAVTDWMGYPGVRDLSQVDPTEGCGKPPGIATNTYVPRTINGIPTPMGQRDNPGDGNRKYFVRLPSNYDPNKKYKVLIGASSCTGGNQDLAAMGDIPQVTNAAGGAIVISPVVKPGVWDMDQCYDDKDPNSIEFPFLDRFLAEVGRDFCYDKNKVFVQGHSSGGWYSNMIGCVHASDKIRAMSSNGGGIPNTTAHRANCSTKPMAGLWIHALGDPEEPEAARRAVSRALVINKCQGAGTNATDETVWEKAPSVNWSVGGSVGCKKYMCPDAFPVIFCQPPGGHENISWHTDAAWAVFNALP